MRMPWSRAPEVEPRESEQEPELEFDVEVERTKMLKMWSQLAVLGIIGAFVGSIVLAPDAFPITISLAMMAGTAGYACGRFLQRDGTIKEEVRLQETHDVLTKIEDDLTTRISRFGSDNSRLRKKIANLERSLEEEQQARLDAQRDLVNHMRVCDV